MKFKTLILISVLAVAGCDRDSDVAERFRDDSGILKFIPADSALVAVRLEPLPEAFRERFTRQDALIAEMNASILNGYAESGADAAGAERVFGLLGAFSSQSDASVNGIAPDAQLAVYAVGSWPVLRVEVADGERLETYLDELASGLGTTVTRSTIEQGTLRSMNFDALAVHAAHVDGYLVLTAGVDDGTADALQRRLGLVLPPDNIADAGTLAELANTHEFAVAQIAHLRPVAVFDALKPAMATAMGTARGWLPAECTSDVRRMLAPVEEVTSGTTRADASGLTSATFIDLAPDFAQALDGLEAPVPGLGAPTRAVMAMGFSIDVDKLREFAEQRVAALLAKPLACPAFRGMNAGVTRLDDFFQKQPTPPTLRNLRGFVVTVDGMPDFGAARSLDLSGVKVGGLLAMKKPVELVSMGNLFVPELAALDLKPDGKARRVPQGQLNVRGDETFVAMSEDRLAVTVGDQAETRLDGLMQEKPNTEAPLLWMEADATAYLGKLGPMWRDLGIMDDALLDELDSLYDRARFSARTTRNGLVLTAEIELKE